MDYVIEEVGIKEVGNEEADIKKVVIEERSLMIDQGHQDCAIECHFVMGDYKNQGTTEFTNYYLFSIERDLGGP